MISPETIAIVGVAALIIFGPKKLPELGKSLGQGIREFKRGTDGLKSEFEQGLHPDAQAAQNQVVTQTPAAQQTITAQAVPVAQVMAQPQVIQATPVQTIPVVTAAPQAEHAATEPLKS